MHDFTIPKNGKIMTIPTIDDICEMLKVKNRHMQNTIERLEKENAELKSGAYAEKELAAMKEQYDRMQKDLSRGFAITEEEEAKIDEWQNMHLENMHHAKTFEQKLKLQGVSGGIWTYEFVPTTIVTIGKCVCSSCRNKAIMQTGMIDQYKSESEYRKRRRELIDSFDAEFEFQTI